MRPSSMVRQRTEDYERAGLSTWATLSVDTKGRERAESLDPLRTVFQQDRDRVVHAEAFRRLADKTQAFIGPSDRLGDGRGRVRLTHALEVTQVARTIARALRLNEDLVEAIALGHDLGHTPFGQAGEEALSAFAEESFRHQEQSIRVVDVLERGGAGLNLTWEVRDGILNHPGTMPPPATLEGQAVRVANRIAVLTHDLEAALRAGILDDVTVPDPIASALGRTHGERVATFVEDVVTSSIDQPQVRQGQRMDEVAGDLQAFLTAAVHERSVARGQRDKAVHCLQSLVVYSLENPAGLPPPVRADDPLVVRVLDEVSGMTDGRALAEFERRFLPAAPSA